MTSVRIFPSITIQLPVDAVYRRLGYRNGLTKTGGHERESMERYMEHALSLISLKGAGLRVVPKRITDRAVVIDGGFEIESAKLAGFLKGCEEILFMGSTAGKPIMDAILSDAEGENLTRGVVMDAVASEMTDAALDWIMGFYNRLLTRENACLTKRRFSAGYGDFLLENQRTIYDILELDRIGVAINEKCILIPEKSVTAVAGIRK
jgi:hypothetical protein